MKRYTDQQLETIAKEFANACFYELYNNKDPEAPVMALKFSFPKVVQATFLGDLNEDRISEHDWIVFFSDMVEPYLDPPDAAAAIDRPRYISSDRQTERKYAQYRPSDAEHTWAAKISVGFQTKPSLAKNRLYDGPPNDSVFHVHVPVNSEQSIPSSPSSNGTSEDSAPRKRSIRADMSVGFESHFIDISIGPYERHAEIKSKGYILLVNALVCWFILRNSNVAEEKKEEQQSESQALTLVLENLRVV